MNKIILLSVLLLIIFSAGAQRNISGFVLNNETQGPIEGVSILVKNTNIGTTTNLEGFYELTIPGDEGFLEFSFMGMISKEVSIEGETTINVYLEADILGLDDVVITAIGIAKEKKALGYSVEEVAGDEFLTVHNDNLINSLSGKVAGLQVTSSSGSAGASAFIMIRGATTLHGNNQPLFVMDGVPISNNYFGFNDVDVSNRVMDINPEDIENVSILKGGAATALYGMRAANGAVVITTKKGKALPGKKYTVHFHSSVTIDKVSQLPKLQYKYGQGYDANWISGSSTTWGPKLDTCSYSRNEAEWTYPEFDVDGAIVSQNHTNATGENVKTYNQYDLFRTAISYFNAINLSGGNETSTFQMSASHTYSEGVVPENKWTRFTLKISGDLELSDKFKIFGSASYFKTGGERLQKGSNTSGVMLGLLRTPPTFNNAAGYELPDGGQRNYRHGKGYDNPYWSINKNKLYDDVNRLIGYAGFNWKIFSWMSLDYKIGIDFHEDDWINYFAIGSVSYPEGRINIWTYNEHHINSDLLLNINHQFNDNWIADFTLGNNMFEYFTYDHGSYGFGFEVPGFYNLNNCSDLDTYTRTRKYRSAAFYGDLEVAYKRMVYLTLTGRNEWSTTLPPDNNSFFFPSASISWIFTELDPLGSSKTVPFGKLRLSYARIANAPDMYRTLTNYTKMSVNDGWVYGLRYPLFGYSGFTLSNVMGNEKIEPEKTTTWEIGTDLRFINNRITLDLTYFNSYSKDLLLYMPVAASSGFWNMYTNAAEMSSKGFEVIFGVIPIQKRNWFWNASFNFTTIKNVVEKLAPNVDLMVLGGTDPVVGAREGDDYRSFYGYDWLHDEEGNVIINDNPESPNYGFPMGDYDTVMYAGKYSPDWLLGWSNSIKWKNLAFGFLIEIKKGGLMHNGTRGALYYFGNHSDQESREPGDLVIFEGVKQSDGSPNDIQVVKDINWYNKGEGSTFTGPGIPYLEDNSWIRLREIVLSYRFDQKVMKNGFIKSLEIYLSGRNLWLSTKYTGIDPETNAYGATNVQGYDYFNMPGTKGVTFGLKADF